jgi:single-strand DNA-binding protein
MSNDLNRCEFIGRLGADPETRYTQGGAAITNIRIAVGAAWKDKATGEAKERTEWIPLVFLGKLGEIAGKYLSKGDQVFVAGEFRTRKWQDKDGQDRYTTEISVNELKMLGGKSGRGAQSGQAGTDQAARNRASQAAQAPKPAQDFDDDIPF